MEPSILYYKDKIVDGISGWHWIETDSGAWDGPKDDWQMSHKFKITTFVQQFRTVIQAGGNQGMYPRLLANMFDTVVTFEPDKLNYRTLIENVAGLHNVEFYCAALGSHESKGSMHRLSMSNVGMHRVIEDGNGDVSIYDVDSLDITNVDLIMFDMEGFELNALQGAVRTINEYKPTIFSEMAPQLVVDFLATLGYKKVDSSAMDDIFVHESKLWP